MTPSDYAGHFMWGRLHVALPLLGLQFHYITLLTAYVAVWQNFVRNPFNHVLVHKILVELSNPDNKILTIVDFGHGLHSHATIIAPWFCIFFSKTLE